MQPKPAKITPLARFKRRRQTPCTRFAANWRPLSERRAGRKLLAKLSKVLGVEPALLA